MGGEKKPLRDERAWLRGRLWTGGVGAREWLEMGGEKKPLMSSAARTATDGKWVRRTARRRGWKWVGRRSR